MVRFILSWSYRATTGTTKKFPADWEEHGLQMAQRVAYLIKAHYFPPQLVVNIDPTGIHLIPTGGTYTWAQKRSKHVLLYGYEDK